MYRTCIRDFYGIAKCHRDVKCLTFQPRLLWSCWNFTNYATIEQGVTVYKIKLTYFSPIFSHRNDTQLWANPAWGLATLITAHRHSLQKISYVKLIVTWICSGIVGCSSSDNSILTLHFSFHRGIIVRHADLYYPIRHQLLSHIIIIISRLANQQVMCNQPAAVYFICFCFSTRELTW